MAEWHLARRATGTALGIGCLFLGGSAAAAATLRPGDIVVVDTYSPDPTSPTGVRPAVILVDRNTGAQTLLASGGLLRMPAGVAVSKAGRVYVADSVTGDIIEVDAESGAQALVPHEGDLGDPRAIAIGEAGEIIVADISYAGALYRIQEGKLELLVSGIWIVGGIAPLPDGAFLLAVFDDPWGGPRVLRLGVDGILSVVSSGDHLGRPTGITVGKDGSYHVSVLETDGESDPYMSGSIITVDPQTGVQTIVARGGSLRYPRGIAVEASGDLLVVDPWGGCIKDGDYCSNSRYPGEDLIRVKSLTGAQTVVSAGQMFGELSAVAVVPGPPALEVVIDVKPDTSTNTINLKSAGVVAVAIVSTDSFDATTVDPRTVSVAGARVGLAANGTRLLAHFEDVNGDGLQDLVCQVVTADFLLVPGDSTAVLEASTFDGSQVRGQDSVRIVP